MFLCGMSHTDCQSFIPLFTLLPDVSIQNFKLLCPLFTLFLVPCVFQIIAYCDTIFQFLEPLSHIYSLQDSFYFHFHYSHNFFNIASEQVKEKSQIQTLLLHHNVKSRIKSNKYTSTG